MKRNVLMLVIPFLLCWTCDVKAQDKKGLRIKDLSEIFSSPDNEQKFGKLRNLQLGQQLRTSDRLSTAVRINQKNKEHFVIQDNRMMVEIYAKDVADIEEIRSELTSMGFSQEIENGKVILGWLPIDEIEKVDGMPKLAGVRPIAPLQTYSSKLESTQLSARATSTSHSTDFNDFTGFGLANNQGAAAMRADAIREQFKVSGRNVKVGIISSSFNLLGDMDQSILDGDLPGPGNPNGFEQSITIVSEGILGAIPFGIDEGRAMAELIHDIAPDAELFFHTGFVDSPMAFANAIRALEEEGCDIIVDDVFLGGGSSVYQIDPMSEAIDEVTNNGVIYFAHAGNFGDGSSRNIFKFYESPYSPVGAELTVGEEETNVGTFIFHQFENGTIELPIELDAGTTTLELDLQWSKPWGSRCADCSGSNYDINFLFLDENKNIAGFFTPNVAGDAKNQNTFTFNSEAPRTITVSLLSFFDSFDFPDRLFLSYNVVSSTAKIDQEVVDDLFKNSPTIVNQSNASSAITVGSTSWFNTFDGANYFNDNIAGTDLGDGTSVDPIAVPNLPILSYDGAPSAVFSSTTSNPIVTNSSIGGIGLYYDGQGNPIATDGQGNIVPQVNMKPDIIAPDGISNTVLGLSSQLPNKFFFGTSAAAPNAAAVATLLFQASNYTYDAQQMKDVLTATALDMDDPYDNGLQDDPADPLFSSGFDFASGNGFLQADSAINNIINEVGIQELTLNQVCSESPTSERRIRITNPNGFGINVTVSGFVKTKLPGDNSFSGGRKMFIAPPGESFFLAELKRVGNGFFGFTDTRTVIFFSYDNPDSQSNITLGGGGVTGGFFTFTGSAPACDSNQAATNNVENTANKGFVGGISVFPNPSSGIFNIAIRDSEDEQPVVEVFDISGNQVEVSDLRSGGSSLKIDLSGHRAGIYLMKIKSKGINSVERLIIK